MPNNNNADKSPHRYAAISNQAIYEQYQFSEAEIDRFNAGNTTDEIADYIGYPEIQADIICQDRIKAFGELASREVVSV